jgi:hypothetical protein
MARNLVSRRIIMGGALALLPAKASAQGGFGGILHGLFGGAQTSSPSGSAASGAGLNQANIGLGLKDALKVATRVVVGQVGRRDGYFGDPAIRIPLPGPLERVAGPLRNFGVGSLLDDLDLRMNRAAEQAAPKALNIFTGAITAMSFDDARGILTGPDDAATQYFRRTTSAPLTREFQPIVGSALSGAGAVKAYQAVESRATQRMPMLGVLSGNFNLTDFVVSKALDGLFHYIAVQEKDIRTNPAARTTDLLRNVFG